MKMMHENGFVAPLFPRVESPNRLPLLRCAGPTLACSADVDAAHWPRSPVSLASSHGSAKTPTFQVNCSAHPSFPTIYFLQRLFLSFRRSGYRERGDKGVSFLATRKQGIVLGELMAELVGPRLYSCCNCRNHVCLHDDVISKAFQGRSGRAFLFSHAMNIVVGPKEDRQLMTGLHTVADIYCCDCHMVLGWKYEKAYEESQKYKEGKFILEKSKIAKENW